MTDYRIIDTGLFVAEVWNDAIETMALTKGIVPYFNSKSHKVYFTNDNPFALLKVDPQDEMNRFLAEQSSFLQSADQKKYRYFFAINYLAEELKTNSPTAPICMVLKDGRYLITKGYKKIVALAMNRICIHPIIVTTLEELNNKEIKNDLELYQLLKSFDETADKFYVRIENFENRLGFHFLNKYDSLIEWVIPLR